MALACGIRGVIGVTTSNVTVRDDGILVGSSRRYVTGKRP